MKSTKGILFGLHLHPLPQLFCHLRSNIDPCVSEIILEASKQLVLGKFFVQKPSFRPSFPCQPRPQGLLAFQNGSGSGEDPGTQQITCLQRGWRCRCIQNGFQNGGYGQKGEKNWVRDAKVKRNKWRKKLKFSSRKNRKNRHVLHVRVLGIRQSVRGLVFAVHCFFFVILKLGVMGLSVLYCGTPYRYLIQCCSSEHIIFLFHEALGNKLSYRYIVTNLPFLNIVINSSFLTLYAPA